MPGRDPNLPAWHVVGQPSFYILTYSYILGQADGGLSGRRMMLI
jgi:hypothetical protein